MAHRCKVAWKLPGGRLAHLLGQCSHSACAGVLTQVVAHPLGACVTPCNIHDKACLTLPVPGSALEMRVQSIVPIFRCGNRLK